MAESGHKVVFDGDSITYDPQLNRYASRAMKLLGRDISYENYGVSGAFLPSTPQADVINAVDTTPGFRNVLVVFLGTNSINHQGGTGITAAVAFSRLQSYCADARAAGYAYIIVITMLPRATLTPAQETHRLNFNSSIVTNAGGSLDCNAVVHLGGDATIGVEGATSSSLPWFLDGVHPSPNAGHVIASRLVAAALRIAVLPLETYFDPVQAAATAWTGTIADYDDAGTPDDDTGFITNTATLGSREGFFCENVPTSVVPEGSTLYSITVQSRARNTAGAPTYKHYIQDTTTVTNFDSSDVSPAGTFGVHATEYLTDPQTIAPWSLDTWRNWRTAASAHRRSFGVRNGSSSAGSIRVTEMRVKGKYFPPLISDLAVARFGPLKGA